ncbi:MAG: type II toxin-antitoxin system Phd/YefM family antitoxin [Gammaproteobacteria bacterium]|nr:antitoxin [Sideroxydans sp.]MBU3902761.1 type II toxin-antitoxin system Phd/YefM family antitoxin [Gammaproteobacteria bacterium]MBU4045701.1 type II toxin-antitoxin system Phd/YefM family antitoxin [Gammaproteobacteria bacterium]
MQTILTDLSVSMTEFKKNPIKVLRESGGHTVAVLSHNKPAFYMVPPERYEAMLEELDDLQLVLEEPPKPKAALRKLMAR